MTASVVAETPSSGQAIRGGFPARIKVLYVTTPHRTGGWLTEAFAADGAVQIVLEEVIGVTAGLARLRDEVFDAVLISHEPGLLDALDMIEGLRAGGNREPMIVLGAQPPQDVDALCYEVGADDYCCVEETTVRGLIWKFTRAIERHQLQRENRRLLQAERQRLQQEHHEAQRLLEQQRALISDLEVMQEAEEPQTVASSHATNGSRSHDPTEEETERTKVAEPTAAQCHTQQLPEALVVHYRELLRAYVVMGAGNLAEEMSHLAELMAMSGISAQRAMQLHVVVLEELVQGLGNRSARHVMNRADLLVLEVMGHLADGYRQRYCERRNPANQRLLPGFEPHGAEGALSYRAAA